MNHLDAIEKGLSNKRPLNEIARKIYLSYPTFALVDKEEKQFEILDDISSHFSIPITSVQVAGSAKTGHSFHKKTPFTNKESDLDIAIIDPRLFQHYMELVYSDTRGYSDRSRFPIIKGVSKAGEYIDYIGKGIFRADLLPSGKARAEWSKFFGDLSLRHNDLFESINAKIYLSQLFFESKQRTAIKNYELNKGI